MSQPLVQHCEVCEGPLDQDRLRTGPLKKVCLECLSDRERDALQHDLEVASQIQAHLLPERSFSFGRWQIHYHYEPLGVVSGDHIDLIRPGRTENALHFLFGDVSGKGVAASILMANLQALFRSLVSLELPLSEIMEKANTLFFESTASNSYATLVAGRLNGDGKLEIINAGHNPPLLVRCECVAQVEAAGLPVGMAGSTHFAPSSLQLEPQDFLFLYTDGISESENSTGEQYGSSRVEAVLAGLHGSTSRSVVDSVLAEVSTFQGDTPQVDDVTAMAIRWRG